MAVAAVDVLGYLPGPAGRVSNVSMKACCTSSLVFRATLADLRDSLR